MKNHPKISIIIPAYNAENDLPNLWHALTNQTYPQEKFEAILVDNNSTDQTKKIASNLGFIVTSETNYQCSYAARNKGVEMAAGQWLVFLDADCLPDKNWLSEAISHLEKNGLDIGSGHVKFTISPDSSASELYDACTNLQIKESITRRNAVMTANLFVTKSLFKELGGFTPNIKSGGDLVFTYQAFLKVGKLGFLSEAIVHHEPRSFFALMKKFYRTAKGKQSISTTQALAPPKIRSNSEYLLPIRLVKPLKESNIKISRLMKLNIFLIHYVAIFVSLAGALPTYISHRQR